MSHGTAYRYDQGCRCDECRMAATTKRRLERDRARAAMRPSYLRELADARARKERYRGACADCGGQTSWSDSKRPISRCNACYRAATAAQHGTRSKYKAGCRCDECRRAARDAMREYKARKRAAA